MAPSSLHVLIVDASPEDRQILCRLLTRDVPDRYTISEVANAALARDACQAGRPDCVLLDEHLPDMDGLALLAALRARSDVPVVLLTGVGAEALAVAALRQGAQDYLVKGDLTPERLQTTVQHAVAAVQLTRERAQTLTLLTTLLDTLPVGIAVLDQELHVLQANAALASLLGRPAATLLGQPLPVLWPDAAEVLAPACAGVLRDESFRDLELVLPTEGTPATRWLAASGMPLASPDGAGTLAVITVQDITARRQAEEVRQRAAARLQVLADTSQAFAAAGMEEQPLLDLVARRTGDVLGAGCIIRLCADDGPWLPVVSLYDPDPATQAAIAPLFMGTPVHLDHTDTAATVVRSGQAELHTVVDLAEVRAIVAPALWPAFARMNPHSAIVVPLRAHGQVLGSLSFSRHTPALPAFTADDLTLAQDLADRAALSIHNVRLYQAAQTARQAAAEAHARLAALITSAPNGIAYFDRQLRYQLVNPALATINRLAPEDHLGYTLAEVLPNLAAQLEPRLRQVLATGRKVDDLELQSRLNPRNEEASHWLVSFFPVPGSAAGVAGVGVTVTDITASKRAAAALRASEERFRLLAEHAHDAIFRYQLAPSLILEYLSPAMERMTGYPREAFYHNPELGLTLIHPDDASLIQRMFTDSTALAQPVTLRWRHRSGEIIWAEVHSWVVTDASGRPVAVEGIARDTTERHAAEEALRASEARYRTLFETMAQGVVYHDARGCVITANPAAARILGLRPDQLQGFSVLEAGWTPIREDGTPFPKEEHPALVALRTGQVVPEVVMGLDHPELDAVRWLRIQAIPQPRPGGAVPDLVYTLFEDITERREAQRALEYERQQLAAILNTMHEGVMAAHPDGTIVLINPAALMMCNLDLTHPPASLAEAAQQGAQEVITPEGLVLPPESWPIPRVLRGERFVGLELGLRSPQDGTKHWHRFNGTPVYDQDGTLILGVVTGQDITERKRDEAQLRQQAAMLDHAHVLIRDAESRIVSWNQGAERLYGWTAEETIGRVSHDLLQTRFPSSREEVQAELFATGRWEGELVHHRRDGSELVVASLQILFRGASGVPAHILEVNNDVTALKRATETLREREAQLELAHEVAGLGTWRHDLVTGLITLDARAQAHHEVEEATFPVAAILARIHPDDALQIERQMQASFDPPGTGRTQIECRVMLPDGGMRWLANHASVVFVGEDAARRPVFGYGTTQDITARKADEAALRAAHAQAQTHAARLDSLLTNAPVGISLLDAELRFQAINSHLAAINGLPLEAHLGRTIGEVLPDIAPLVEPIYAQVLATGKPLADIEIVGETPAEPGVSRIWRGTYFPVYTTDHTLLGVGAIIIDITAQRQLERALQTEHRQLAAILENLDEGVMAFQPDGTLVTLNSAVRRHLGWPADAAPPTLAAFREMFRHAFYDPDGRRLPPEDYPTTQALRGQPFQDVQLRLVREPDGQERWFAFTGALVHDAEDALELVVVTARDITVERQADLALRESRQNLQALIDSTDGALWSVDTELRLIVGNVAFHRITRALLGHTFAPGEAAMWEEFPPALADILREFYARALAGEHFSATLAVAVASEQRVFEARVSPTRTTMGEIIGATMYGRDITEQQRAEQALRDTERKLGTLFELLPVGVAILDTSGELAYTNPAMERIMRLDRASLAAHAYNRLAVVRPDGTPLPAAEFAGARALREQQPVIDEEAGFITEAGERVWVSSSAVPVDFPDWKIVVVMTEITARIQADLALRANAATLARTNAELSRVLRLKDEFLAMMSHELRTPLNVILGFTEGMEEGLFGPPSERQREVLGKVLQSGRHLLAILSDILDLAHLEAGAAPLEWELIDVDILCRSALQFVQAAAQQKGIRLLRSVEAGVVGLRADERRLTQILVNLLDNAVKFTPVSGSVGLEVTADAAQERIQLVVWDTGIGIAAADLDRLFQPFTQVDGRLSRQYGGVGLGLSLVRRLVDLHSGSIALESVPGQGSRFTVSLPWSPEANVTPRAMPLPALPPSGWSQPPRVVLADDHEITLQFYAELLRQLGCAVVVARTGAEAVAQIRATRPDVAILDIQMPELDGLSAIRQIRVDPEVAATPIIALTALAMPGDRERCLEAGARTYLAKPVGLRTLMATITNVLTSTDLHPT